MTVGAGLEAGIGCRGRMPRILAEPAMERWAVRRPTRVPRWLRGPTQPRRFVPRIPQPPPHGSLVHGASGGEPTVTDLPGQRFPHVPGCTLARPKRQLALTNEESADHHGSTSVERTRGNRALVSCPGTRLVLFATRMIQRPAGHRGGAPDPLRTTDGNSIFPWRPGCRQRSPNKP